MAIGVEASNTRLTSQETPIEPLPWLDFFETARRTAEPEVQRYFLEAVWCLRSGAFRAAAVVAWVAIAAHLRNVCELVPEVVRRYYIPSDSRSEDGEKLLHMCRMLSLCGLRRSETTDFDQHLKNLLVLRNQAAHTPPTDFGQADVRTLVDGLTFCSGFLKQGKRAFRFGNPGVIVGLCESLPRQLEPTEASQLLDFVEETALPRFVAALRKKYLESLSDTPASLGAEDEALAEARLNRALASYAAVWNVGFSRLSADEAITEHKALTLDFAARVQCRPVDHDELVELVPLENEPTEAMGKRTLGELSALRVWRRGSPEKYRDIYYECFVRNPGELWSVSETGKEEILEHSPRHYTPKLREAFHGYES